MSCLFVFIHADQSSTTKLQHLKQRVLASASNPFLAPTFSKPTSAGAALGNKLWYSHGVGFGGAGEFLQHPKWICALKQIMPQTQQLLQSLLAASDAATKVMLELENNPVLAAYVASTFITAQKGNPLQPQTAKKLLNLEWDIFLSNSAPSDLTQARIVHGKPLTLITQNIFKNIPISPFMPEVSVAPTPLRWLEIFGKAIKLVFSNVDVCGTAGEFLVKSTPAADAIKLASQYLGSKGGLVIDMKSTYSTPAQINSFISSLRSKLSINVAAVGSFVHSQLVGLDRVLPVYFFHTAFGFLAAHGKGALPAGATVMFNGGSLFQNADSPAAQFSIDEALTTKLKAAQATRQYKFAYYVQEPGTSCAAARVLISWVVSKSGSLGGYGLAWGNNDNRCDALVKGSGLGSQAPMYKLEKLGVIGTIKQTVTNAVNKVKTEVKGAYNTVKKQVKKLVK